MLQLPTTGWSSGPGERKQLYLLVKSSHTLKSMWLWNACSACTYINVSTGLTFAYTVMQICTLRNNYIFLWKCLGVTVHIYMHGVCVCVRVCSQHIKVFSSQSRSKPSSSVAAAVRAGATVRAEQWQKEGKKRKSAASRKECSLRNTAASSLLGPLLLSTSIHP